MTAASPKKPDKATSDKAKAKSRINSELQKIDTVIGLGQPFGSITTFDEFLAQAEKLFKAYDIEFKKEKFDLVKKPDGNNKKDRGLPR